MARIFPDVTSARAAMATGVSRSADFIFSNLRTFDERSNFLRRRFPNLPDRERSRLLTQLGNVYSAGKVVERQGQLGRFENFLPRDPTIPVGNNYAYDVYVDAQASVLLPNGVVEVINESAIFTIYSPAPLNREQAHALAELQAGQRITEGSTTFGAIAGVQFIHFRSKVVGVSRR